MSKDLIYNNQAKQALKRGVDSLANAVRVTLGPKGKNVIIDKSPASPSSTKDGVSVAKDVELSDPFENMGSRMVKEVASKTSDDVGDGTTTSIVLSQAMFEQGLKYLTAGYNPVDIQRGMERATEYLINELTTMSIPVATKKEISHVASISANSKDLGELIADALEKIGKDGVITVEESKQTHTTLETTEGMEISAGYLSSSFVTDKEKSEVYYPDARVLITSQSIVGFADIFPLLEKTVRPGIPLVIVASDITDTALKGLTVNASKLGDKFKVVAVKAPSYGDKQKEILEDIAVLTGGTVINKDLGMLLKNVKLEDLGTVGSVTVSRDKTLFLDARGDKDKIVGRIQYIKGLAEGTASAFDRDALQERISKLSGGVAVLHVGGYTETAIKELKDRLEDALHATQAAVQSGVVVGGGVALLRAGDILANDLDTDDGSMFDNEAQMLGARIIQTACEAPIRQLAKNCGTSPDVVVNTVRESDSFSFGYDAEKGIYQDLKAAGVIDPAGITISALQNASSVVGVMLLTECLVSETVVAGK